MDVTIVGLSSAGKTSLVRVLAVCHLDYAVTRFHANILKGWRIHDKVSRGLCCSQVTVTLTATSSSIPTVGFNMKKVIKGHVTLRWYVSAAWRKSTSFKD